MKPCACSQIACHFGLCHRLQCNGVHLHISVVYIDTLRLQLISQGGVNCHHQIVADLGLLDTLRKTSLR